MSQDDGNIIKGEYADTYDLLFILAKPELGRVQGSTPSNVSKRNSTSTHHAHHI